MTTTDDGLTVAPNDTEALPVQRERTVPSSDEGSTQRQTTVPSGLRPVEVTPPPAKTYDRRRIVAETAAGTAAGVVAAVLTSAHPVVLAAVVLWGLLSFPRVPALGGPVLRQLRPMANGAVLVLAGSAFLQAAGVLAAPVLGGVVAAVCSAFAASALVRTVRVRRAGAVRVLLVGDLMEVSRWAEHWRDRGDVDVVGAVLVDPDTDPERLPRDLLGVPAATQMDDLPARVEAWGADLVALVPSPGLTHADARRAGWALQDSGAAVAVVGLFEAVAPHRIRASVIGGETLCEIEPPRRPAHVSALKHALDRAAAGVLLALIAPVLGVLALAIRLDSPGSAIFRQTRIGRHGRPFTVYKLRTMRTDAEEVKHTLAAANEFDDVLFKMRRDPRVTRLGHFLRRSSLDELPQLLNVLAGDMSLVGPRPFVPSETAEMSADDLRRLAVKPGVTGLWQVSGRSDLDWQQSVALDTYYADNWTLGGDAKIAVRTVKAVLGAKGAY